MHAESCPTEDELMYELPSESRLAFGQNYLDADPTSKEIKEARSETKSQKYCRKWRRRQDSAGTRHEWGRDDLLRRVETHSSDNRQ